MALGQAHALRHDWAEAQQNLEAAWTIYRQNPGPAPFRREAARAALVAVYRARNTLEPGAGFDARAAALAAEG